MNRIENGDFSSGFDNWDNGVGGLPYTLVAGEAKGSSDRWEGTELTYIMLQQFSSSEEVVSAKLTIWAKWEAILGRRNGRNVFVVKLRKPDATFVTLVDTTKDAVSGSGNILDESNIAAHMTQYGSYRLYLYLYTRSAWLSIEPDVYEQSFGWYDNISLDIAVKKYKTVHERMGSSEESSIEESSPHYNHQSASEIVGLSESYLRKISKYTDEMIGLAESYFKKTSKYTAEMVGLGESYSTDVYSPTRETASEIVGLSELYSMIRTVSYDIGEGAGLSESIQAKRTRDGVETTYIFGELTQWDEISQAVTPWITERIEII